ncbi:MAG: hypothetical protein Q4C33_03335 [bacterium]|nr:hypothetical protein [bacterium]
MKKKKTTTITLGTLEKCSDDIDSVLDEALDNLFSGKKLSRDELLELNCKLSLLQDTIVDLSCIVDDINVGETKSFDGSKKLFRIATICNIILLLSGAALPAFAIEYLQYRLYARARKEAADILVYIGEIGKRGKDQVSRLLNYLDVTNIRIKKSFDVQEELEQDESRNQKFDMALDSVNALLKGYEMEESDEEVRTMVMQILKDGNAEGNTIDELAASMRDKLSKNKGGVSLKIRRGENGK